MSDIERLAALGALARARQAEFIDADHKVYLFGLQDISDQGVIDACLSLLKKPRMDGRSAMPSVGEIRAEVGRIVARRNIEREEAQRRAALPAHINDDPRIAERMKGFREDVEAAVRARHSFPS